MNKITQLKTFVATLSAMLCLLLAMVKPAQAALDIEVTQAMDATLPIAVAKFEWAGAGAAPEDLDQIINADLGRTGEFRVLERNPLDPAYKPDALNYTPWVESGADHLVIGKIQPAGAGSYRVDFALLDVFQGNLHQQALNPILLEQTFTVNATRMRGLAHHISDLVYEKLLGVRGAFSTRIAYVNVATNSRGKRYRLEISDADGYNPVTILDSPEPVMSPSWSPDGHKLAYVSFERHRAEVYVADVITGTRSRVSAKPGINGAPAWSPDGKSLAIVLSNESIPKVYVLNLASAQLKQVTFGRSIDTEPNWSADGRRLLFTSDRGGHPQIYELDLASNSIKRITFEGDYNARAAYTPDGNSVVFIHRDNGDYHIAAQNLRNSQLMVLTKARLDESPSLSPNGRMVIYGTIRDGRRVLGAVSIDGRVKLLLPATEGEVQEPAWSPFLS